MQVVLPQLQHAPSRSLVNRKLEFKGSLPFNVIVRICNCEEISINYRYCIYSVDSPWRRFRVFFFFLKIGFAAESSLYPASLAGRRLSKAIGSTSFCIRSSISIHSNVDYLVSSASACGARGDKELAS